MKVLPDGLAAWVGVALADGVGEADGAHREGIRILHVEGLGGGGGGQGNGGNFADSVVNSALRFRAQAPLIDQLLREIGVQGGDIGQAAKALLERSEKE